MAEKLQVAFLEGGVTTTFSFTQGEVGVCADGTDHTVGGRGEEGEGRGRGGGRGVIEGSNHR